MTTMCAAPVYMSIVIDYEVGNHCPGNEGTHSEDTEGDAYDGTF